MRLVMRAVVAGTGGVGGVEPFAQGTVVGVGDDGVVAGEIQRQQPAFKIFSPGFFACGFQGACRHAHQLGGIGDKVAVGLHAVHEVFLELGLQFREPQRKGLETRLLLGWQRDARELEIAQRIVDHLLTAGAEIDEGGAGGNLLVGAEQGLILRELDAILGHTRQRGVVSRAPGGRAPYPEQMRERPPLAADGLVHHFHRLDQVLPIRGGLCEQLRQLLAVVVEHCAERGLNAFGREGRKCGKSEHGVRFSVVWARQSRQHGTEARKRKFLLTCAPPKHAHAQ